MSNLTQPIRLMELRSTYRWGGGPDKTILNSALMHDPKRVWTLVTYLRSDWDNEFSIGNKARSMGLNFEEIIETKAIDFSAFKKIISLIKQNNIDIVHSHDYKSNFYALLIKKFFCNNVKIVTTAHGWVGSGFKLDIYHFFDKILVASFDRNFILFKDMIKLYIRKPTKQNTVVIHNAIDPKEWSKSQYEQNFLRSEFSIPLQSKIIGFTGRIMPEKDILTMVEVANAIINTKKIDAFFILIGESKDPLYDQKITEKVNRYNLATRFLRIGSRSNIAKLYRDFDIFLMTSIQEGFPNSLLEAMAMEVPSVVTSIDGIPEIIKNNESGILCNPGDFKAISDSIERLLNDSLLNKAITKKARAIVENELSFDQRLRKIETEYERLTKGN